MIKAVFLDRDGTLNKDPGYVFKPEDCVLQPRVKEGLKLLQDNGYKLFIVSNQSGIARGMFSVQDMAMFNAQLLSLLPGIRISKFYFCPHAPDDDCGCRKPSTQSIDHAIKEFGIDRSKSWVIGDMTTDLKMAEDAKLKGILVLTGAKGLDGRCKIKPKFKAQDMFEAAKRIIKDEQDDNNKNPIKD